MSSNTKKVFVREVHEVIRIRRNERHRAYCTVCIMECDFLTLDEGTGTFGIGTRQLSRLIETGGLHAVESARSQILICVRSLGEMPGVGMGKGPGGKARP